MWHQSGRATLTTIMPQSGSSEKGRYKTGKTPFELKNRKEWDPDKNKPEYELEGESEESYNDDDDEYFIHRVQTQLII